MKDINKHFYGAIESFDEEKKTVEAIILHFGIPNENLWTAMPNSLDAFIERIKKANKNVVAYYQHDSSFLIGKWLNLRIEENKLMATLELSDIPFVRDVVIPQLKDGTLQGSSPEIGPLKERFNQNLGVWEVIEGVLCEASLVGLPADLDANIIKYAAKIEAQTKFNEEFEIELL